MNTREHVNLVYALFVCKVFPRKGRRGALLPSLRSCALRRAVRQGRDCIAAALSRSFGSLSF
jgi:hypothetical protein